MIAAMLPVPAAAQSDVLDQSQMGYSQQLPDGVNSFGMMDAQIFTAGRGGQLDRVEVYVAGDGAGALDVAIQGTTTITNFAGTFLGPDGVSLGQGTVTPAATPGWVDVTLAAPVPITAGTPYAIVLSTTSSTYFSVYGVYGTTAYAGGQSIHYGGGQWYPDGYEMAFQTYVLATVSCRSGTISGGLTVGAGQSVCLGAHATVTGPVRVEAGGSLDVEGASIAGPVRARGAESLRICGAHIRGPLSVTGSTGAVVIGDGGACAGSTFTGPLSLTGNTGGVSLEGDHVTGPVAVSRNSGGVTVENDIVEGPLTVTDNAGTITVSGNTVSGPTRTVS